MPDYKVWCPDDGETVDDAEVVKGYGATNAAEGSAERRWSGADPFNEITLRVLNDAGAEVEVVVEVRIEPAFYGRVKKGEAP